MPSARPALRWLSKAGCRRNLHAARDSPAVAHLISGPPRPLRSACGSAFVGLAHGPPPNPSASTGSGAPLRRPGPGSGGASSAEDAVNTLRKARGARGPLTPSTAPGSGAPLPRPGPGSGGASSPEDAVNALRKARVGASHIGDGWGPPKRCQAATCTCSNSLNAVVNSKVSKYSSVCSFNRCSTRAPRLTSHCSRPARCLRLSST